ncbi:MAG: Lrp/AsnC family transcriptional regulator [Candidatus Hodarchaeales archaeon]|jgi:DNA-binding Lrp family transcriptional regulator
MLSAISKETLHDIFILISLRSNNSLRGLATKLNLSTSQFKKIINYLKTEELIKNWNIIINPNILPKMKILFFFLKTNPNEPEVVNKLFVGQFHYIDTTHFLDSLEFLYSLAGKTGFQKYQLIEVIEVLKISGFCSSKISRSLRSGEYYKLEKIRTLNSGAKMPMTSYQIAQELNLSQPAIAKLLKRWKDETVILGYSIKTDYWKDHFINTYIQLKAPLGKYQLVIDYCIHRNEVQDVFRTNHEYSLLLRTRFLSLNDLNSFLQDLFQHSIIEDTITSIVLDFLR